MNGGAWTFFMGGCWWLEVYFGWRGWLDILYGCMGGSWRYILGEWGCVDIFYGWVGVGGGTFWVFGVSGGEWG